MLTNKKQQTIVLLADYISTAGNAITVYIDRENPQNKKISKHLELQQQKYCTLGTFGGRGIGGRAVSEQ